MDEIMGGLLAFASAPAVLGLVAEPDFTVLLPALHLAVMDGAPIGCMVCVTIAILGHIRVGSNTLGRSRARGMEIAGPVAVFTQPGKDHIGLFQQVFAGLGTQGELTDKAIGCGVTGIPGSRSFEVREFGGKGLIRHDVFSFKAKNPGMEPGGYDDRR